MLHVISPHSKIACLVCVSPREIACSVPEITVSSKLLFSHMSFCLQWLLVVIIVRLELLRFSTDLFSTHNLSFFKFSLISLITRRARRHDSVVDESPTHHSAKLESSLLNWLIRQFGIDFFCSHS